MADRQVERPYPGRGLSARLLAITVSCLLLGAVMVYIPSIVSYREAFLEARLSAADLASLAVEPGGGTAVPPELERALLEHAGVLSITLWEPDAHLVLGRIDAVDQIYDLRESISFWSLIDDSFVTLASGGERVIRVTGPAPRDPSTVIDIVLSEHALWSAMVAYSWRVLGLSITLALAVALLLFSSLRRMIVAPLSRITQELHAFRERPEDVAADPPASRRVDEIGVVQRELAEMRQGLRQALAQKTRLAALGAAVSRIHHDLRNLLATAVLLSERLDASSDPAVRSVAPRLVEAMERAARLCAETLSFARSRPSQPQPRLINLSELVDEVLGGNGAGTIVHRNEVPADLEVTADPDQLYRILLNIVRNARQALGDEPGEITVTARTGDAGLELEVIDTGPGVPSRVQERLFEPFSGSGKADGSGLGLAIARELARAHGGDISIVETSPLGTTFQVRLPERCVARRVPQKV
ncbi:MAG TPA: HAMP domain-containing sensor histidine kinase [Geminicoccaceae bacterium]|nr:HAMP domain-containing sensor histidine kinase [Geminicoccus sp.]HMU48603.1 HAMP domain-containing sensor histidine kinase [Geminicoccaceae bacterium]